MMLKSLKMMMIGALMAISNLANAGLITVEFQLTDASTTSNGYFSGEDNDLNGLITADELTAIYNGGYNGDYYLADLYAFGDFDIATVTWYANAESYFDFPEYAYGYMTFADQDWSCTPFLGCNVEITSFIEIDDNGNSAPIPEPSTLAIFALGILGLGLRKAKK